MTAPDAGALERAVEELAASERVEPSDALAVVEALVDALERGTVRAAEPDGSGGWRVHAWVKRGLLLGFRYSPVVGWPREAPRFRDKSVFLPRDLSAIEGVRAVPGGTAVRRGSFVAPGVVLMPPCYVNCGAWIGEGSMIDSHALVGSCAQIGARVHLSAGAQIGGVLEPPAALPVIVEDDAFVGGLAGVFEGVRIGRGAVIGAGVVLTRSTPVYDLVTERRIAPDAGGVLAIPERSVVVAGSRPVRGAWAAAEGLAAAAALIVKRRDEGTDARAALESALR